MSGSRDEQIRARAYRIWEEEGRPHGVHDDHWRRAEQEIGSDEPATGPADDVASEHPGMMGDGTEEQNLNQPGHPEAQITADEVEEAFGQIGKTEAKK